jgi:ribosomal protein S18 acetylase RimI-like enzyme
VECGWQPAFGDGSDEVVPAIQLSRLGVDHNWQRQGLGSSLVLHAVEVFSQLTAKTDTRLLVAKAGTDSEQSAAFCRRFGFRALDSAPGWLYLVGGDVLATVAARR